MSNKFSFYHKWFTNNSILQHAKKEGINISEESPLILERFYPEWHSNPSINPQNYSNVNVSSTQDLLSEPFPYEGKMKPSAPPANLIRPSWPQSQMEDQPKNLAAKTASSAGPPQTVPMADEDAPASAWKEFAKYLAIGVASATASYYQQKGNRAASEPGAEKPTNNAQQRSLSNPANPNTYPNNINPPHYHSQPNDHNYQLPIYTNYNNEPIEPHNSQVPYQRHMEQHSYNQPSSNRYGSYNIPGIERDPPTPRPNYNNPDPNWHNEARIPIPIQSNIPQEAQVGMIRRKPFKYKFNGQSGPEALTFIIAYEQATIRENWNDEERTSYLADHLTDSALNWLILQFPTYKPPWHELKRAKRIQHLNLPIT